MSTERHGRSDILLHFVWATKRREPLITPDVQERLYACMLAAASKAGCEVLAIGGIADHVHLAVRMSTATTAADLARRIKGTSSTLARQILQDGTVFRWQDGYGVYSFSRSHRQRVISYIHEQERHHSDGDIWEPWESKEAAS